ncbi:MAG: four helix bundle protein [Tannerella sp.]|jgi:four helix bundle protein|nr:four helix bundle protein [Tannerella sp.]
MERVTNVEFNEGMRVRTKKFALDIIRLSDLLPNKTSSKVLGKQLLDSATSLAANFRAACRGRSKNEFYSKICIVVEESDETQFWLEMIKESNMISDLHINPLLNEIAEITAIVTSIKHKLKL